MTDNYKVHKAWINEVEFEILILEIPKEELEDKLAYLARDKGSISKSFYEDFVITICIANINQLLFHIKQLPPLTVDLLKIRAQVVKELTKINPLLDPSNLIINRNSVVKIKSPEGLKEDERLLTDNKSWNKTYYDESDGEGSFEGGFKDKDSKDTDLPSEIKKIDDLDFEVVNKWWARIRTYVNIKKFNEKDMASILSQRFFHNRSSFQTYIVTVCVVDSEDLFITLDNMGIPSRVAPPTLMYEVYELCREVNPFLTFENAQELVDAADEDEDEDDVQGPPRRGTNSRMMSHARQQKSKKKKKKKTFRDVPKEDLLKLADTMKVFVIGQDSAVDQIVEAVQRASVGLKDPVKPIGSFLFAGRTGIGKTLTTKVLADELIKDRNNLVTIDCSEYSADHEYAKLIGAPSGYVGHEQGGILTNAVLENPFSVVVFDEIEKASTKVYDIMLQILEEGRLTDGKGQKVSFKDTIIIMTSNIGVSEVDSVKKTIGFGDVSKLTDDKKTKAIDGAIKNKFKPEFLNRIDAVVHFNTLVKKDYMRIIDIELYKLNENLKTNDTEFKKLKLEFDRKIKEYIFKHGIDDDFGARPLKRSIEKEISTPLAARLLRGDIGTNATVEVTAKSAKVDFKIKEVEPLEEQEESVAATEG